MKKKIVLALIMVATTLSLTGCGLFNQAALEEEALLPITGEVGENSEAGAGTSDEASKEDDEENSEANSEAASTDGEVTAGEYTPEKISAALPTDNVKMTIELAGTTYVSIVNRPDMMMTTTVNEITSEVYYVDGVVYTHTNTMGMDIWMKIPNESENYIMGQNPTANIGITPESITNIEVLETISEDGLTLDVVKVTTKTGEETKETTLYINTETGYVYKMITDTNMGEGCVYVEPNATFTLPAEAANAQEVSLPQTEQ